MKKIAVLNDLSGLGKCSLTAAIPVISVMGIQACPLPTAVLSCQTDFPSYFCDDYTDRMDKFMDEWKNLDFQPDGIYTGFLADAAQADKVVSFIEQFGGENVKILVDPVMGDDGEEYPIYTEALCEKMRFLVKRAAVITPNLTEALLLLHGRERAHKIWSKISNLAEKELKEFVEETGNKLAMEYETEVVITGIDFPVKAGVQEIGNLICAGDSVQWVTAQKVGGSYSGTGDLFASVLSAGMVKGTDTVESVRKAVNFLAKGIRDAVEEETDRNEGICFEKYLYELAR